MIAVEAVQSTTEWLHLVMELTASMVEHFANQDHIVESGLTVALALAELCQSCGCLHSVTTQELTDFVDAQASICTGALEIVAAKLQATLLSGVNVSTASTAVPKSDCAALSRATSSPPLVVSPVHPQNSSRR